MSFLVLIGSLALLGACGPTYDVVIRGPMVQITGLTGPPSKIRTLRRGMKCVFVNGRAVGENGKLMGALPGRALRGPGYHATIWGT